MQAIRFHALAAELSIHDQASAREADQLRARVGKVEEESAELKLLLDKAKAAHQAELERVREKGAESLR